MVLEQAAAPERGRVDEQQAEEPDLDAHWELALEHRRRLRRRQREREHGGFAQPAAGTTPDDSCGADPGR